MSSLHAGREGGRACVLSDGRFAVFGGRDNNGPTPTCRALTLDGDIERWNLLPPMREARELFACWAIGGCVFVAGGLRSLTAEVYEEATKRWRRLPCNLPNEGQLCMMGSAIM